jgi:hypothetical protein
MLIKVMPLGEESDPDVYISKVSTVVSKAWIDRDTSKVTSQ